MNQMIGRWAVCQRGHLFRVTEWKYVDEGDGIMFVGQDLQGKKRQSVRARFINTEDSDMLNYAEGAMWI